jgi:hypothetical protein
MKKILFTLLVAVMAFGCQKENNEKQSRLEKIAFDAESGRPRKPIAFPIDRDTIAMLAAIHNKTIIQLFENYGSEETEITQANFVEHFQFNYSALQFESGNAGTELQLATEIAADIWSGAYTPEQDEDIPENIRQYAVQIAEAVENSDQLPELLNNVTNIEQHAEEHLDEEEASYVFYLSTITKYSAKLWFPEDQGGLGYFSKLPPKTQDFANGRAGKIVKADLYGATASIFKLGFRLAFLGAIPGANVAILGGWVLDTAVASAMAFLTEKYIDTRPEGYTIHFERGNIPVVFEYEPYLINFEE